MNPPALIVTPRARSFLIRKKPEAASRIGVMGLASRHAARESSRRLSGQSGVLPPADLRIQLSLHGAGRRARLVSGTQSGEAWLGRLDEARAGRG